MTNSYSKSVLKIKTPRPSPDYSEINSFHNNKKGVNKYPVGRKQDVLHAYFCS